MRRNPITFAAAYLNGLHSKRFEPVERNHDGLRHHGHRFPIKDGISVVDLMAKGFAKPNALLAGLKEKGKA